MQLYPHQRAAVDFLKSRRTACLADDMGLGKTISVAVAARELKSRKLAVVAPSVALWNWQRELRKWAGIEAAVLDSTRAARTTPQADCLIAPHSLLRSEPVRERLAGVDVLVGDEAHCFKTPTAARTRKFYGLAETAERTWLLTGTPMPNNASELWTMLHHLHDDFPERFRAFRERYCELRPSNYGDGWKVVGNKNARELRERMDGFMLRRKKTDVLDLPPKRVEVVTVQPTEMPEGLAELERKLRRRAVTADGIRAHDDVVTAETPEEAFQALRDHEHLSRFRRLSGLAKVEPAVEMVRRELAYQDCIVLFAQHTEVIDQLAGGLAGYSPVVVDGRTSAADRQRAVDAFQSGQAHVFIGQIQAAGTAITLTRATEALFVETSYTPGDNAQCADRIYRIGQTKPVRVRMLALAHSIDEIVTEVLQRKVAMISELMG